MAINTTILSNYRGGSQFATIKWGFSSMSYVKKPQFLLKGICLYTFVLLFFSIFLEILKISYVTKPQSFTERYLSVYLCFAFFLHFSLNFKNLLFQTYSLYFYIYSFSSYQSTTNIRILDTLVSLYSMSLLKCHYEVYNYLHIRSCHNYYFQENSVSLFSSAQYIHPLAFGCTKMKFLWMKPEHPNTKSVVFPMLCQ